jgi:ORF6N domain
MENKEVKIPEGSIISRIYVIRGQKIMIDRDLAEMYGVETKRLKESVRRNMNRFPADFMFVMNNNELNIWRTHIATSREMKKGLRHNPF